MSTDNPQPPSSLVPANTPTQKIILHHAWKRMNIKNEHFMCAIVGREGKAKSHTAIKIASGVDPTFDADRIFFEPDDVLRAFDDDELGKGQMLVLDEAGAGMGNRTWYERDQILTNQALQTVRNENMGLLWTLPRLTELDSQTRGRLHAFIEMTRKYPEAEQPYAVGKWKNIDPTRDERDKLYKEYPRIRIDGVKQKIKEVAFTPPDPEIVEAYEPRKNEWKSGLIAEALEAATDEIDEDAAGTPKEIAQEIAEEDTIDVVVSENGTTGAPYINKDLIRLEYDISHSDARAVKSLLEQTFSESELEEAL